jgi:hypothetical protein
MADAAIAGAACFGASILGMTADARVVLAALALALLFLGGAIAHVRRSSVPGAIALGVVGVAAARWAAGPMAAVVVTCVIGGGAALRVRWRDVEYGIAVLGAVIAVLSGAPPHLLGAFWLIGVVATLLRRGLARIVRRMRKSLTAERHERAGLAPET